MPTKSPSPLREAQQRAWATGGRTFTTDIPCRHGHLSPRYTATGVCVECSARYNRTRYDTETPPQLTLPHTKGRLVQVRQDEDAATLTEHAKRLLRDIMERPVSMSVIHKAGIVLLADYLNKKPTASDIRSLIA